MDFIIGLPKYEGNTFIMVVVDRLTKYAHFCYLSHPFKSSKLVATFMEIVQKLHGLHNIIVTNGDPIFTGNFWTELLSCLGTQLTRISYYHPQSNGKTEFLNKFLEGYIHCFAYDKQTPWVKWFPLAKWCYNKSFHAL
jgi:hypothetical protein